jgi:alpha-beta hydrolase superfamily lysophospholipase
MYLVSQSFSAGSGHFRAPRLPLTLKGSMAHLTSWLAAAAIVVTMAVAAACSHLPSLAAGGLLHPGRRKVSRPAPAGCEDAAFAGAGVTLRGWRCAAAAPRRGAVVFLHGVADNRTGVAGTVKRFTSRGLDVIAYDSRAHGESDGEVCTYGYYEKDDLRRVLDTIPAGPIVAIGASLGAAVAVQAAADDPRITTVIAAEIFSDLRAVARERAPFFLTDGTIRHALALAEKRGRFEVDKVSPADAASRLTIPVLLSHGAEDTDTRPAHAERVFANLRGRKRLILVDGARHNHSLSGAAIWLEIEQWVEAELRTHRQP